MVTGKQFSVAKPTTHFPLHLWVTKVSYVNLTLQLTIWCWNCILLLPDLGVLVPVRTFWKTHCWEMETLVHLMQSALILHPLDQPAFYLHRNGCPIVRVPSRPVPQMLHLAPKTLIRTISLTITSLLHSSQITCWHQTHNLKVNNTNSSSN